MVRELTVPILTWSFSGAHVLQGLATKLNELFNLEQYGPGKEMDNIVQLISHLYNFKVHTVLSFCNAIYDVHCTACLMLVQCCHCTMVTSFVQLVSYLYSAVIVL